MKSNFSKPFFSLLFVGAIVIFADFPSAAQTASREVELEIRQYVEEKGLSAKVPADITNLVRGDLNNDGKEDVVIQYYVQIGYPGNLTNTYLVAFLNKNGKMTFTAEMAAAVVLNKIENKVIVCDKYGEGGKKFDKVGTVKFKLAKRKLVEIKAKK